MSNGSPMRRASLPAFPRPTRARAPLVARTMRPDGGLVRAQALAAREGARRAGGEARTVRRLADADRVRRCPRGTSSRPGARGPLQGVVTNDVSTVDVGGARYNLVLNEGGGVIEDLIVYRLGEDRYFVVPNASNTQRVLQILGEADAPDRVHLMYHQDWCFLAVQGQRSPSIVTALFPEARELSFMRCVESAYRRRPVIVTRSGYTGE